MVLFRIGKVCITARASSVLSDAGCSAISLLARHESGDWGEVDDKVAAANQFSVERGHTMHLVTSHYSLGSGRVLAVVTSSDHASTRIELLSEQTTQEVDLIEGYARWAETYDLELNPLIAVEEPRVQAILNQIPMRTALDAGAGTGRHAIALAQRGVAVTAVDQSPDMLAVAREKAARAGLEIDFRTGSLEDRLPLGDDQFDFLVCALTLSHIPGIDHAVRECVRVVKPGGSILISDIHPDVANGLGWTARLRKPGATYTLPFAGHSRSDYLDSVEAAGCSITSLMEVPVGDAPMGTMIESSRQEFRDRNYCLLVVAKKNTMVQASGSEFTLLE